VSSNFLLFVLAVCLVSPLFLRRRQSSERILIIGSTPLARQLVAELSAGDADRRTLVGVVDDVNEVAPLSPWLLGPLEQLAEIVAAVRPDRIVLALADRRGRLPVCELLQARVQGIAIEEAVSFYERLTGKIAIEALTPSQLIASPDFRKGHLDLAFGHAVSLLASFVALALLAPLMLLIALAIKLDSPGPVFFIQDRAGIRGRRFRLMKFRTMRAAAGSTSEWVRDNGDRITRVGRLLRRYRLDELPQLVNVLRGEMNLVGPRPHPLCNFELFIRRIPYYWLRSVVRPGLTGWAQIRQGYANGLEEETEKMRYDLFYVKRMSAWLDLQILFGTIKTVVTGNEHATVGRAVRRPGRLRIRYLVSRFGLVPILIALLSQHAGATHVSFEPGDILVSVEQGPVLWYQRNGTPVRPLVGIVPGTGEGMGFDPYGNLYVTRWCADPQCSTGNTVEMFDVIGRSWGPVGSGYDCNPHSVVFDAANVAYVGQAGCRRSILKFVPGSLEPMEFAIAGENQGAFWIDLSSDGCTLFYTSYGPNVKRFDGCSGVQLADFTQTPVPGGETQDLRVLPDGGVLVSSGQVIARFDVTGTIVQTYQLPGASRWAGLDLDDDGTFVAANYETSQVCRFDLFSGALVACFDTAMPAHSVVGVRIKH